MSNRIPDLPILGEPLIAEFANTLYVDATSRLDVLDKPAWIEAWLQQAPCAANLTEPGRIRTEDAEQLRALRDAVRGLLTNRRGSRPVDIEVVNATARSAISQHLLASGESGELHVVSDDRSLGISRLLWAIAVGVIDAVENGTFDLNQTCSRPGCNLFYFRDHHRRRYCNPRCAGTDRQARYNSRRNQAPRTQTFTR